MSTIQQDAQGSINKFLDEQKQLDGETLLFFTEFDSVYNVVYPLGDLKKFNGYTLLPRGMTALLDAIGRTVTDLGTQLASLPEDERPGKVIVVVVTDGGENSSHSWNATAVKELIKQQEDVYSWEFVFLAANQDAIATGAQYGFSAGNSMTYDVNNIAVASAALNSYVTRSRSGVVGNAFTDDERTASVGG